MKKTKKKKLPKNHKTKIKKLLQSSTIFIKNQLTNKFIFMIFLLFLLMVVNRACHTIENSNNLIHDERMLEIELQYEYECLKRVL